MIKDNMQVALNKHLNEEIFSAYLYWSMSTYFLSIGFDGFANWMKVQAQEEMFHATKFFNYIDERGGRVVLKAIAAPDTDWKSPLNVFENAYEHEQKITGLINDLVDMALEERDHATVNFLQWFVAEQVEEESTADDIVTKLKLVGEDRSGLFMLDREMGTRVFTPPPAEDGQ